MRQRNTTKPNGVDATPADRLTPQQAAVCDLLAGGRTLTDAAAVVGVDRATVSQWTNHNLLFQASLNQRRQQLWADIVEGLRGLLPQALAVLQEELEGQGPGRLTAAVHLLKCTGLYGQVGAPTGPATVEDVEQAQRCQALERTRTVLTEEDSDPRRAAAGGGSHVGGAGRAAVWRPAPRTAAVKVPRTKARGLGPCAPRTAGVFLSSISTRPVGRSRSSCSRALTESRGPAAGRFPRTGCALCILPSPREVVGEHGSMRAEGSRSAWMTHTRHSRVCSPPLSHGVPTFF